MILAFETAFITFELVSQGYRLFPDHTYILMEIFQFLVPNNQT